jgi:hypothetical protein
MSIASRPVPVGPARYGANHSAKSLDKTKSPEIASLYDTGKLNKANAAVDKRPVGKSDKALFKSLLSKDPVLTPSSIEQASEIWSKIQAITVPTCRLSESDNDLVQKLVQVTNNNPLVTKVIMTDQDPRVLYVQPALLLEAAKARCGNTQVQKLVLKGMKLGNEFAAAWATSLQSNCILDPNFRRC